jgi:dTDP-4-dehydrorhamnose 3,5-epimerase
MLEGIVVRKLTRNVDERGCFTELIRNDWTDLLTQDVGKQANFSTGHPGVVRAWHRHMRGQVDYFVVLEGSMKICAYDEKTKEMAEVISSEECMQVVRIPGHYWHGTKVVGSTPAKLLYFVNRIYDVKNPDEERKPWDEPFMPSYINGKFDDPRCCKVWNWNACINK